MTTPKDTATPNNETHRLLRVVSFDVGTRNLGMMDVTLDVIDTGTRASQRIGAAGSTVHRALDTDIIGTSSPAAMAKLRDSKKKPTQNELTTLLTKHLLDTGLVTSAPTTNGMESLTTVEAYGMDVLLVELQPRQSRGPPGSASAGVGYDGSASLNTLSFVIQAVMLVLLEQRRAGLGVRAPALPVIHVASSAGKLTVAADARGDLRLDTSAFDQFLSTCKTVPTPRGAEGKFTHSQKHSLNKKYTDEHASRFMSHATFAQGRGILSAARRIHDIADCLFQAAHFALRLTPPPRPRVKVQPEPKRKRVPESIVTSRAAKKALIMCHPQPPVEQHDTLPHQTPPRDVADAIAPVVSPHPPLHPVYLSSKVDALEAFANIASAVSSYGKEFVVIDDDDMGSMISTVSRASSGDADDISSV